MNSYRYIYIAKNPHTARNLKKFEHYSNFNRLLDITMLQCYLIAKILQCYEVTEGLQKRTSVAVTLCKDAEPMRNRK